MKKFFITTLATMLIFGVSTLNAAPSTTGGGASTKQVKKSTTQKRATSSNKRATSSKKTTSSQTRATNKANTPLAQKSKAQLRKEAQQKAFGLMPSELDNMAHNVFHADAAAIKGARDTESALRYLPFVTIINTAGFGNQLDLRGQGRLSSTGIKFQINGIDATPVDSYYGFMPINTILPFLIQDIEVKPSVEARGGTINVVTSKRGAPYFLVGGGYVNTMATEGHSFNAYAQAVENLGAHIKMNAGLAFNQMGGPREDDSQWGGQAVLGAEYDIGWGQRLYFDVDFFMGKTKTTPYNSFMDDDFLNQFSDGMLIIYAGAEPQEIKSTFKPSKENRAQKGDGVVETSQMRALGILGLNSELSKNLNLDIKGFYFMNNHKFDKHETYTPFIYIAKMPLMPLPFNTIADTKENNFNFVNRGGSTFNESKFGLKAQLDYKHTGGLLAVGYEGSYEIGKRNPQQILRTAPNNTFKYELKLNNNLDINKFTNGFYIKENFSPTNWFSLMAGMKYDLVKYDIKADDDVSLTKLSTNTITLPTKPLKAERSEDLSNFVFELAPVLRYSNTGLIYLRGETGYNAPPAYGFFQRKFAQEIKADTGAGDIKGFESIYYEHNDLKSETYYTAEFGFKELIGTRMIPLGITSFDINALLFSANVFYTASQNEFYFTGDPYSGMAFGTYDKSRRMGVELAAEQYFFNGALGFNESFTYLKAEKFGLVEGEEKWDTIPYTYDYKATFGVNVNISHYLEIIDVSLGVWLQNSLYGNQRVPSVELSLYNNKTGGDNRMEILTKEKEETLDPYIISDFGVSVGFNKNAAVITVGVKNVFDTFYYDYYNHDQSATINENRYVVGRGRTVFIEGQYKY